MIESRWRGHGLDCQAVDREAVDQIGGATLRQTFYTQTLDLRGDETQL